ncbi:ATP-binding protein [bacterium]|nr:ATP-binding protein [bacterium]
MFNRIIKPIKSNSYFLFGPRGTGKTTFLRKYHRDDKTIWIDLLDPNLEDEYTRHPETLTYQITAAADNIEWIVIDEIQKVPKLLNLVHHHIEDKKIKFALTGSSAKKLKKDSANLLAGRAFMNYLFPLTHIEMGDKFDLVDALQFGTLPKIFQLETQEEKSAFLKAYSLTYLKEEIWAEHIIRQIDPFRRFLEIAAQSNGQIINFTNIARDVGADTKTVQSYFEILEDTLVGTILEPFHCSIRKRQRKNPKFYYFDTGVKRALELTLTQKLLPHTYAFGRAFEHFIIVEAVRLNTYFQKDFRFSYVTTKDGAEIDLIIERPGMSLALVEIKSSQRVDERDTHTLENFFKELSNAEAYCLSLDPERKKIGPVWCLPWQDGLKEIGLCD